MRGLSFVLRSIQYWSQRLCPLADLILEISVTTEDHKILKPLTVKSVPWRENFSVFSQNLG